MLKGQTQSSPLSSRASTGKIDVTVQHNSIIFFIICLSYMFYKPFINKMFKKLKVFLERFNCIRAKYLCFFHNIFLVSNELLNKIINNVLFKFKKTKFN